MKALRAFALCALTAAAYANSFHAGFAFDSRQLVLQDPRVHAATAENVDLILQHSYWWPYGESGLYRPMTTLSYLFNYALLGSADRPASYHAFNLLMHLANVLLVWLLLRRVTRQEALSFAAAAIWAVLPLSTEAVTNIVGRADLLAALGVLSGLLMYLQAREARGAVRAGWLLGMLAATTAAVFSKESGIVIAPIVAAYELVWRGKRSAAALAAATAAMAAPLLALWIARARAVGAAPSAEFAFIDNPIVAAGFWIGRLTALKTAGVYLWRLASPAVLSADYSFDQIPLARGSASDWLAWLTVAACTAAIVVRARHDRATAFFGAFALIAFVPASNLLLTTGTIFGERLLYLPSAGLVAVAALAAARWPKPAASIAAIVVVAFGARTWARNRDWESDLTLWRAAVVASPSSAKAHRALAEAMYDADPAHANIDAVIAEAERSVAILDRLPDDLNDYRSFRQLGAYYLDARRSYPRALMLLQRAARMASAGARIDPNPNREPEADIDRLLAAALLELHDPDRALEAAVSARDLNPLNALAYRLAAQAHLAQRRADEAAVDLMAGSMVTSDAGLGQALLGLYAQGLDAERCAVSATASGPALNPDCPMVRRHTCAAVIEAARLDRRVGRVTAAERLTSTARTIAGCRP